MIKKYNQYITESSDNKYSYPYNRIMILISSYQDYLDIIEYIKKTFSVNINFFYNMQSPNRVYSHVLLDVDVLYRIMNTYKKGDYVDEDDVICFYTSRDIHGQDLIDDIDVGDYYLNKKDILNVNELSSVMNLLLSGRKYSFNEIYQKNRLVYESLLDKLEGPTKEEIEKHYKDLYLSGKINIFQYYRYSIDNGFKGPDKKDVSDFLEGLYNNKKIKLEEYYELTRDYKLDGPSKSFLWKIYGFDKEYDPEEYFIHLTDGIEKVSPNGLYYNWIKNGKVVFEQYIKPEKLIFMKYDKTFKIYELLFDMDFRMFSKFMKEMFDKYFSNKINIYEYNFRIEYKY